MSKPLSKREQEIAELVAQAKSNPQIAAALALSEGTVKEYIHRTMVKLGLRNRTDLAMWWHAQKTAAER